MTNANVKATCEAAGMRYPCYGRGGDLDDAVSACSSSPCLHGTCEDHVTYYSCHGNCDDFVTYPVCQCEPGWLGDTCQIDIDECQSSPCPQNATCVDHVNGYTCQCPPGFTGDSCETDIDECSSAPCPPPASCLDSAAGYTCVCPAGYTGDTCQIDIDECAGSPCLSGGTCLDRVDGFSCVCPPEATGQTCETVHADQGQCYRFSDDSGTHQTASATCHAIGGRLADVREPRDHLVLANLLSGGGGVSYWSSWKTSHGLFVDGQGISVSAPPSWMSVNSYGPFDVCVLLNSAENYRGTYRACAEKHNYVCESDPASCTPDVCQHGGTCTSCFSGSAVFCDCLPGYTGDRCQTDIDECAWSPCVHGGTCLDLVNSYSCQCAHGYTGTNCETDINWCDPNPCPFDWVCVDLLGAVQCQVPAGRAFSGDLCTAASCGPGWNCREDGPTGYTCFRG
ncbi:uncharacterized protein LOC144861265 [Branchiostoma floridae x Branchiostoma japonicum]